MLESELEQLLDARPSIRSHRRLWSPRSRVLSNSSRISHVTGRNWFHTTNVRMLDARVAANPPYVKDTDRGGLSPTGLHEPHVALFGGVNGMRDIMGVLEAAVSKLRLGGWLIMEFGFGQRGRRARARGDARRPAPGSHSHRPARPAASSPATAASRRDARRRRQAQSRGRP